MTLLRKAIHKDIEVQHRENLLIFLDADRTQSLWYWVKRDGTKSYPRQHLYVKGPGPVNYHIHLVLLSQKNMKILRGSYP